MTYQMILSALGDPTRRAVFESLKAGPAPVGAIAAALPVSRPAVSQHLKVLRAAGLVRVESFGVRRVYALSPGGLAGLRSWLDHLDAACATNPIATPCELSDAPRAIGDTIRPGSTGSD